jgi:HK97 family phage major capsid protein
MSAQELRRDTLHTCGDPADAENASRYERRQRQLSESKFRILSLAKQAGRTLTDVERADVVALDGEWQRCLQHADGHDHYFGDQPEGSYVPDAPLALGNEYLTSDGKSVRVLSPRERVSDLPAADGRPATRLHLGRAIRGVVCGKWDGCGAERLAMSEGSNVGGGYLVSEAFSSSIIDMARAQSRIFQAGCQTIVWPQPSDELVMARVAVDPIFRIVGEGQIIPGSDISFDQVRFSAKKIGTLLTISRELMEDAANAADIIQSTLVKAFAAALDRMALCGEGGQSGLLGLLNQPGIGSTDSVGQLAWADVHAAAVAVRSANFEPNAYIISPVNAGVLDLVQATDSGVWLGPPASLNGVQRLQSNNAGDEQVFVGQWDQMAVAIRTSAAIELSTAAGTAFEKHNVLCKLVFRGDCNCFHRGAFHVLKGVTQSE